MMSYEEQLEKMDKEVLKKRILEVSKTLNKQMHSNAQNICDNLLKEKFDEFNCHDILNSINNINNLMKAMEFVKNGIINPEMAKNLDDSMKK